MLWLQFGTERFPLRPGETTLGRSRYCSIVVDSPTASREHAAVRVDGDHVELSDLGSRNGTAVNGHKLKAPATLRVGDIITIGSCQVQLIESAVSDDSSNTVEGEIPSDPQPRNGGTTTLPDT